MARWLGRRSKGSLVGMLIAAAISLLGPARSAAADTSSPSASPSTFEGMPLPVAWATLSNGSGPVISFDSTPGTGPTQLEAIQQLYPQAVPYIPQSEQATLSDTRVGSSFTMTILNAVAPSINATTTSGGSPCTDPNLCDYFKMKFNAQGEFNGYHVTMDESVDGYRDDGASTSWV